MTTCNREQLQFLSLISHFTCYLQVLIIVYIALHTYCTWLVARNVSWLYWEGWQLLLLNTPLCYSFKHGHIFHKGYKKIRRKTEVFGKKVTPFIVWTTHLWFIPLKISFIFISNCWNIDLCCRWKPPGYGNYAVSNFLCRRICQTSCWLGIHYLFWCSPPVPVVIAGLLYREMEIVYTLHR